MPMIYLFVIAIPVAIREQGQDEEKTYFNMTVGFYLLHIFFPRAYFSEVVIVDCPKH